MRYSPERKEAVLKKMLPPHHRSLSEASREEGISEGTLYLWRKEARQRGLYPEQMRAWRAACEQANDWDREQQRPSRDAQLADQKRLRDLERELRRKEQALAEAAALLGLLKKSPGDSFGEGADE